MSTLTLPPKNGPAGSTVGASKASVDPVASPKTGNATTTPPKPRQHPLDLFVGKRIVLQRGPVIYTGRLHAITGHFLVMRDTFIDGTRRAVMVDEVFVNADPNRVEHIHLEVLPCA